MDIEEDKTFQKQQKNQKIKRKQNRSSSEDENEELQYSEDSSD